MHRLIILLAGTLVSCSLHAQSSLHLASDIWPPFTNEPGHRATASELVDEALRRSGITASTTIGDFGTVIDGIRSGTFDGSAALWYSGDRAEYLLYSDTYLQNRLVLVGRKTDSRLIHDLSEAAGKRVAIVGDYEYGEQLAGTPDIEWVKGASDQENLDKLLAGETDYMLVDELLIHNLIKTQPEAVETYLNVGVTPVVVRDLYFAVRKDIPEAPSIIAKFNENIKAMKSDGTYNHILKLDWISMDIDGDGKNEYVLYGENAGTSAPENAYTVSSDTRPPAVDSQQYVINGQFFQGWERVPQQYKVSPAVNNFGIDPGTGGMKISF